MKVYLSHWGGGRFKKGDSYTYKLYKLSSFLARRSCGSVHLITDDNGAEELKGIKFDSIDTSLNSLPKDITIAWSLGKIFAFKTIARKKEPFIHIDNDVLLFDKISPYFESSHILAQHLEHNIYYFYRADQFINSLKNKYYFLEKNINAAANMGIFGGNNFDFIDFFCDEAIKMVLDEENKKQIQNTYYDKSFTVPCMIEQYYMTLLADIKGVKIDYLFGNVDHFNDLEINRNYTHIWAAKHVLRSELEPKIDALIYHYDA